MRVEVTHPHNRNIKFTRELALYHERDTYGKPYVRLVSFAPPLSLKCKRVPITKITFDEAAADGKGAWRMENSDKAQELFGIRDEHSYGRSFPSPEIALTHFVNRSKRITKLAEIGDVDGLGGKE